jgi:hypothetical protein
MKRFAYKRRTKPADASAIAAFLTGGGQILKVPEAILVPVQDVLEFLKCCGLAATHSGTETKVYWCEGKRMHLSNVVALANVRRRAQQLPPFAV